MRAAREHVVGALDEAVWTGGLGLLMSGEVEVWACVLRRFDHPACPAPPDLACYTFNEVSERWAYWGPNSLVKLVRRASLGSL